MSDGKLTLDGVSCNVEHTPMLIKTIIAPVDSITLEVQRVLSANRNMFGAISASSVLFTAVSVLASTSKFEAAFGMPGAFWHSFFYGIAAVSVFFVFYCSIKVLFLRSSIPADAVVKALMSRTKKQDIDTKDLAPLQTQESLQKQHSPSRFYFGNIQ